jgi:hypothetical protein
MRLSIPLLRRVFPVLNASARSKPIDESTKKTTLSVKLFPPQSEQRDFDLAFEAEQTAKLAVELRDHVDNFIYGCPDEGDTFYFEGLSIDDKRRIVLHYSVGA